MWWHNFSFSLESRLSHWNGAQKGLFYFLKFWVAKWNCARRVEDGSVQAEGSEHCWFSCWTCFYIRNIPPQTFTPVNEKGWKKIKNVPMETTWIVEKSEATFKLRRWTVNSEKSYTGEGSACFKKLEEPVWRPKGRQLNKFRSVPFNLTKTNCYLSLNCLPSGLQSCFQAISSFPWLN